MIGRDEDSVYFTETTPDGWSMSMLLQFFIANVYQVGVGIIVGLGTILYYESLTRLKAAQTSALELSTPVFATILAFYLLFEVPTIMQIVGIVFLFLGLYFISKKEA